MEDQQEELTPEGKVLKRIRKQMREQEKKKWKHPDADIPQISIAYVWREQQWIPITWIRGTITPHKIHRLRNKYIRRRSRATRGKIGRKEVLRIVEMRVARSQGGAGAAPIGTIQGKTNSKGTNLTISRKRVRKWSARRRRKGPKPLTRRLSQMHGKLGRCDYKQCKFRAFWSVCYMDDKKKFGKKKTVKHRCTKHAWKDEFFPVTARHVFRIERKPRQMRMAA